MKLENETAKEKRDRHIARARGTGGYFFFFRNFGQFLKKTEALFLQDLINRREMAYTESLKRLKHGKKPTIDDDGYFKCTVRYLGNPDYLVWTADEQRRLLPILIKREFVKIKKVGIPSKRWLWINFNLIEETLDEVERHMSQ